MRHFSERELACKHCGLTGCTDELKQALDAFRNLVGRPVLVHDAFRCTIHNAAVSLVSKSQHPAGTAADISVDAYYKTDAERIPALTLQQMYDAAKSVPAFDNGGIGVYDKNFIHVDVRNGPVRWAFVGSREAAASVLVTV